MEIKSVSNTLGVPAPTIRRWTREFQVGLRSAATSGDGRPRVFTPRDIRLLRRAKELLGEGLTYEQTRRRLSDEGLLQPPEEEQAESGPSSAAEREAAEKFVRAMFERFSEADRREQAALARRVESLERQCADLTTRLRAAELALPGPMPARAGDEAAVATDDRRADLARAEPPKRTWPFR